MTIMSPLDSLLEDSCQPRPKHDHRQSLWLIAGGAMKRGHFHFDGQRPLADLWLTLAQRAGLKRNRFADSMGTLKELAA